jgi:ligand-binding sensor domain-containing protein
MKYLLFGFLLFLVPGVFAQGYKHFSIEQGLPSNRTYKILQDYDGFIWIATDKGLSKFDGADFKNYTTANGLPSNDIWQIMLTQDNKLWYFTRSNELGYIYHDSIHSFKSEQEEILYPTNITTDLKQIIFRSFGHNYALSDNKWRKLKIADLEDQKKVPLKLLHPKIDYLLSKQTAHKNIILLKNKQSKAYDTINLPKGFFNISGQINDSLVLVRVNKGMMLINLNTSKAHTVKDSDLFKTHVFTRVLATEKNIQVSSKNIWAELNRDYKITNKRYFPEQQHLATLYKDRQGNFWGTTNAKGFYFYPKNSLSSKSYLAEQPVQFLKLMKGNLFAGVLNKGVYKYNPQKDRFELFFKDNDYLFDMFYLDDNNFAVFANTSTIVKRKGKIKKFYRAGRSAITFNGQYAVRERNAISIFDKNLEVTKSIPFEGANTLAYYQKHLIAGTPLGLFRYKNNDFEKIEITNHPVFPILSLAVFKDYLIIGTDGLGAYVWDGKQSFDLLPKTKNLIINHIFLSGDDVWLSTQKGAINYKYDEKKFHFNKLLRKTDGIISDHVNYVAVLNGKLFTSNLSGIKAVDLSQITPSPLQKVYFKTIKYNDRVLTSRNNEVLYQKNNNLSINFGIIDYLGQEHNEYFYKLIPVQNYWTSINTKNVNFNSLAPNDYNFVVKVVNPYGQVQTASFSFTITPRWWQRDWAKFLMVFLFLTGIFTIAYWMRRKELRKQRQKLVAQKQMAEFELYALRSQMNPHFVFNSLNAIQYYINDENYDKSEAYLVRFARLIRMIFEFSRKKTIKLKQEINLLQSYLNLEKMRFGDNFNYCVKIDPKLDVDQTEIPTLLLQPIVENAVNHGIFHKKGKGTICLTFNYMDPKTFEVIIQDDGVGIEKSKAINKASLKKHQSRSTQILKDRIKLLNLSGKWRIDYQFIDATNDNQTPYNTIVKLKITKL